MKAMLRTHVFLTIASPALAADPVPYDKLVKEAMGDATPRAYIGKSVTVNASNKGEIGYYAKKADAVTFVCKSGAPELKKMKVKSAKFRGTIVSFQGWDGATVFELKDCALG